MEQTEQTETGDGETSGEGEPSGRVYFPGVASTDNLYRIRSKYMS